METETFKRQGEDLRGVYTSVYKSNFLQLCKDQKIVPDLSVIYGYRRVSTGALVVPGLDNQFYVNFPDKAYIENDLKLEAHEFTEA